MIENTPMRQFWPQDELFFNDSSMKTRTPTCFVGLGLMILVMRYVQKHVVLQCLCVNGCDCAHVTPILFVRKYLLAEFVQSCYFISLSIISGNEGSPKYDILKIT